MAIYEKTHQIRTHSRRELKEQRLAAQKANKEYRQERAYRTRYKGAKDDIELANIFAQFGIDFFRTPHETIWQRIRENVEGRRPEGLSKEAIDFLSDNFDATVERDSDLRPYIHFPKQSNQTEEEEVRPMQLYSQIAERCGQTRKTVRIVYEAIVSEARSSLRHNRLFKLPELGRLKVNYRPPREKRRGRSPFTGEKMWFKAKPAMNKLRFSPAKALKDFVQNKVEVVAPKKKHKK